MLTDNQIKEDLSFAYVCAIAAQAGFAAEFKRRDMDGIDLRIESAGRLDAKSILLSPALDIQLKATAEQRLSHDGEHFVFDLRKRNFDLLRGQYATPRILVVLFLRRIVEAEGRYIHQTEASLSIPKCAYYVHLNQLSDLDNHESVTVYIPKSNIFSPDYLTEILTAISKQEKLR